MPIDLITQRLKLKDVYPKVAKQVAADYELPVNDIEFIRKGIVPSEAKFEEGERASIDYISTKDIDRDFEIVEPKGAVLKDYQKNPVVLWAHKYDQLPLGKCMWIKQDENGLIAKTQYAPEEANPFAEQVYQYRKAGFPLAKSIGFIPLKFEINDKFNFQKPEGDYHAKITRWLMLEYSDVPVPSNPGAVEIAMSKGLISKKDLEKDIRLVEFIKGGESERGSLHDDANNQEKDIVETVEETVDEDVAEDIEDEAVEDDKTVHQVKTADPDGNPSVYDIMRKIEKVLNPPGPQASEYCYYICDLYPTKYPSGHCIVHRWRDDEDDYYRYEYEYKDAEVKLIGEPVQLEQVYQPVKPVSPPDEKSISFETMDIKSFAESIENLKLEVSEIKEGRVLSTKNRNLISDCISKMNGTQESLQKLLEATQKPEPDKTAPEPEIKSEPEKKTVDIINTPEPAIDVTKEQVKEILRSLIPDKNVYVDIINDNIRKAQGKVD